MSDLLHESLTPHCSLLSCFPTPPSSLHPPPPPTYSSTRRTQRTSLLLFLVRNLELPPSLSPPPPSHYHRHQHSIDHHRQRPWWRLKSDFDRPSANGAGDEGPGAILFNLTGSGLLRAFYFQRDGPPPGDFNRLPSSLVLLSIPVSPVLYLVLSISVSPVLYRLLRP